MNLRKYAKNKSCMIRLPGCTNEGVVLAHYRHSATGMGKKAHDLHGAWACTHCHDIVDGRKRLDGWRLSDIDLAFFQGILRTQEKIFEEIPDVEKKIIPF